MIGYVTDFGGWVLTPGMDAGNGFANRNFLPHNTGGFFTPGWKDDWLSTSLKE